MSFLDLVEAVITATDAERATLEKLLTLLKLRTPMPPGAYSVTATAAIDTLNSIVAHTPVALRPAPSRSKRVTTSAYQRTAPPSYAPTTKLAKAWWKVLTDTPLSLTSTELAKAIKKPSMVKDISNTLGRLYKVGVVTRKKDGASFAYARRADS